MTLQNKLQDDLITARKSKNQAEIEAIGFILAQIRYDQIDKQREPTEEEVLND